MLVEAYILIQSDSYMRMRMAVASKLKDARLLMVVGDSFEEAEAHLRRYPAK